MKHIYQRAVSAAAAAAAAAVLVGSGASAAETKNTMQPAAEMVLAVGNSIAQSGSEIGEEAAQAASDPYRDRPDIDPDDWMYILANPWNDIGDYTPELETLEGQQFDERIIGPMQEMADAARAKGLHVFLSSG